MDFGLVSDFSSDYGTFAWIQYQYLPEISMGIILSCVFLMHFITGIWSSFRVGIFFLLVAVTVQYVDLMLGLGTWVYAIQVNLVCFNDKQPTLNYYRLIGPGITL